MVEYMIAIIPLNRFPAPMDSVEAERVKRGLNTLS